MCRWPCAILLFLFALLCSAVQSQGLSHRLRPIGELLAEAGFPYEEHIVATDDGFLLGMTRIPAAKPHAPAVLLMHGLLDSGATWLLNQPDQSLGFILYRHGWDVWMGNSRGNTYSRNHTFLDPSNQEYWDSIDFSAMGQYDLPAFVDHILLHTGRKTIAYIGHSQGTTQMFAALPNNYGHLQQKLSLFIALSPVAYVKHIKSVAMRTLAELDMDQILELIGQRGFVANKDFYSRVGVICIYAAEACKLVPLVICGADMNNLNASRFSFYLEYFAAGTSVHNMMHWAQHVRTGRFGQFDWGTLENMKRYNHWEPPQYNLSAITVPTAFFAGGADTLSEQQDIEVLSSRIRTVIYTHVQPEYAHLDFVWGLDAHQKVYPDVLSLLQKYGR